MTAIFVRRIIECANHYKTSLSFLLLFSGFFGFGEGILTATWQVSVEVAQVLLGLVSYPSDSLAYMWSVKTFSIINYLTAGVLALTHSEKTASIITCGVIGLFTQQVVAMIIFFFYRNGYVAVLASILFFKGSWIGHGIAYPIFAMGSVHTFGRIGMIFVLYAMMFLALGRYRTGLFLSGLALSVHPVWAAWWLGCLGCAAMLRYSQTRTLINWQNSLAFIAGVAISADLYVWQTMHYPVHLAPTADPQKSLEIYLNYIRYWDHHRNRLDDAKLLIRELMLAWISLLLVAEYVYRHKKLSLPSYIFCAVCGIFTILGTVCVFVPSWFDPAYFPQFIITGMPGRFINLPIFLCGPLVFGCMAGWLVHSDWPGLSKPSYQWIRRIFLVTLAWALVNIVSFRLGLAEWYIFFTIPVLSVLAIMRLLCSVKSNQMLQKNSAYINAALLIICLGFAVHMPVHLIKKKHGLDTEFAFKQYMPQGFKGSILTTSENQMTQVKGRLSILPPKLDGYSYLGEDAMIPFNQMVSDLYGVSFLASPPAGALLHMGALNTGLFQPLWEARSCEEWQALGRQYQFNAIWVPATMQLQLRSEHSDKDWNFYSLECE